MSEPEFLVCMECDTPCYVFEWDDTRLKPREILCGICGNEKSEEFQTEDEYSGEE